MKNQENELLKALNKNLKSLNIEYCFGASFALKLHGIDVQYHDFDLFINENFPQAYQLLKSMGKELITTPSATLQSTNFASFEINGFKIDLIQNFKINYDDQIYEYKFNQDNIKQIQYLDSTYPIGLLEDWYILYFLMERNDKVNLLNDYLEEHPFIHPEIIDNYPELPYQLIISYNCLI